MRRAAEAFGGVRRDLAGLFPRFGRIPILPASSIKIPRKRYSGAFNLFGRGKTPFERDGSIAITGRQDSGSARHAGPRSRPGLRSPVPRSLSHPDRKDPDEKDWLKPLNLEHFPIG
jgi:hypothetical protein